MLVRTFATATIIWMALSATPVAAAEGVASGWWTSSPASPVPEAERALLVQGGLQQDQMVAYAAVDYVLAEGEQPARLTLAVADGSASTPTAELMVCPLIEGFDANSGGAMADAPAYDCQANTTAAPDAGLYAFEVAGMEDGGRLRLAILPTSPTTRVALEPPDVSTLESSHAASGPTAPPAEPSIPGGGGGAEPTWAPSESLGAGPTLDVSPGVDFATPGATIDEPSQTSSASSTDDAASAPTGAVGDATGGTGDGVGLGPIVLALLAAAAAALWAFAGHARTTEEELRLA